MKFKITACLCFWLLTASAQPLILLAPLESSFLATPPEDPSLVLLYKVLRGYPDKVSISTMSWSRAEIDVVTQSESCIPVRKTPERETYLNFSLPYKVLNESRLVIRKDSLFRPMIEQMYEKQGSVSLAALLAEKNGPVLGVDQTRSYGQKIDELIAGFKNSKAIYVKANLMSLDAGSVPMLLKGHIDMLVEYQLEIGRYPEVISFPLTETERFVLVYFGCSKSTKAGNQLVQLNQTIQRLAKDKEYQRVMLSLLDEGERPHALAYWHSVLFVSP